MKGTPYAIAAAALILIICLFLTWRHMYSTRPTREAEAELFTVNGIALGDTHVKVMHVLGRPTAMLEQGFYEFPRQILVSEVDGNVDRIVGTTLERRGAHLLGAGDLLREAIRKLGEPTNYVEDSDWQLHYALGGPNLFLKVSEVPQNRRIIRIMLRGRRYI